MDTIDIGSTPSEETAVQVGTSNYGVNALIECSTYIKQIQRYYGLPPEGSRLAVVPNSHEFGTYYEVGLKYSSQAGFEYGLAVEHDEKCVLREWDDEARKELRAAGLLNDMIASL